MYHRLDLIHNKSLLIPLNGYGFIAVNVSSVFYGHPVVDNHSEDHSEEAMNFAKE